ncbi:hypothetical protein F511_25754 [Dorcoceras hygrometricum]|uniref:Dystroglycan-like n=1 Tax=Dorcoceras hygrometricum TaxID=472368 RepID=A0A2Z7BKK2_9LAMI|nr:hypothetical protein F511_25754 [Dorcoceras hygrometricum]
MASSLFVNTVHVCFESVLAMDNAGMVEMLESLVATGLKGFLGCPTVIHEAALLEFFRNGSVKDGLVVSTMNGVTVEISEHLFAETFELPVEGLTDFSDIPKDIVFDARSIVSLFGEPVSTSRKKREMTIEFRLLCDILAKTISVKAGSFDAITQEKFLMMATITCGVKINWNRLLFNILKDMVTPGSRQAKGYAIQVSLLLENVPNLELGESSKFPSSKILTEKTVHRYISLNDKEAVPLQIIAPTAAAPTEQPPSAPKHKIQKRKRRLVLGSDDESVEQPAAEVASETTVGEPAVEVPEETVVEGIAEPDSEPAVADVANAGMSPTDDVDTIIGQVLAETAQIGPDEEEQDVGGLDVAGTAVSVSGVGEQAAAKSDEVKRWFHLPYEVLFARDTEPMVTTASDTDEDMETVEEMETEAVEQSVDEAMSLEDILMTIPVECPLPSVNVEITKIILGQSISIPGVDEGDWYKAGLPNMHAADKGKAPIMERYPVKDSRYSRLSQLCTAFVQYSLFSGLSTDDIRSFVSTIALDRSVLRDVQLVQSSVFVSSHVQYFANSAVAGQRAQILLDQWSFSSTSADDSSMHFVEDDIQLEDEYAPDQFILTSSATAISASIAALRESFSNLVANQSKDSRKTNTALSEVLCKIDHVQRVLLDSLADTKAVRTQNVILSTDLEATRKEVNDIKATLSKDFDDKLADIRNELLEFRIETQGQLASLSTHLAEIIAFLTKGSDDKKGEDSSSRRPQPPPDNQGRPSGGSDGTGNRADEQSRPIMPPKRRGRARGQFPEESEGQNEEVRRSIPLRRCYRQVEDEVDELASRVDDMELVMARFQQMNP